MDGGFGGLTMSERPLRLDAPREEALEHAARLVEEAWRSFDRFRPEEPALDERVRELLGAGLPERPSSVHEALDDAARILDESIAQPRPRYFAFIGSSRLEIGAIGDLLAHTYDINLAVDARAATQIEHQAVRWVGEFVGFPAAIGRLHERRHDQQRDGARGGAGASAARARGARACRAGTLTVYCSPRCTTRSTRAVELLGIGSDNLRDLPIDDARRLRPDALAEAIDRDRRGRHHAGRRGGHRGHHAHRRDRSDRRDRRRLRGARRVAPRRRRLRPSGRLGSTTRRCSAGLERADSCSVDAHKWLYLPKACGGRPGARHEDVCAGVRARAGLPAAPAARAARRRHHARVLAAVPRAEAVARLPAHGARQFRDAIARNLDEADLLYRARSPSRGLRGDGARRRSCRSCPSGTRRRASRPRRAQRRRWRRRSRPTAASTSPRR